LSLENGMHASKPLTPPAERSGIDERPAVRRGEPGARLSGRLFAVTALGAFMASLDLSIVNVAFPALQRSFPGTSRSALAWVITAYVIAFASLLVTAGRMADRVGRRRAFFAGVGVFAAGSALTALASSVPLVVGGRVVQGVGAALLVPSSLGLLLAASLPARRAQIVALWGGAAALAVAVGPSLGGVLISSAGWRSAFYINLPVAALALLVGRRWVPPDPQPARFGGADYGGVVLISTALAGLVLAITEAPDWGFDRSLKPAASPGSTQLEQLNPGPAAAGSVVMVRWPEALVGRGSAMRRAGTSTWPTRYSVMVRLTCCCHPAG
jgi:MFS family permease